jgi:protein arginine N-methyltransferase 2
MAQTEGNEKDFLLAQKIISAAERHDIAALKILLKDGSANVYVNGKAPLHATIASGSSAEDETVHTVELLLQNGGIWNDLNAENETPGCIALKLGLRKIYDVMVDAGVRAEMLFGKMKELGMDLDGEDGEDGEDENGARQRATRATVEDDVSLDNHAYLKSKLRYRPKILLDESDNAVMMDWEEAIMIRHAETLIPTEGLRTMNVGHGLGLVDKAMLARSPAMHHIVEAHPQVQEKLRREGWYEMKNVTVHEGRWQDVLPRLVEEGVVLDAIYYDTFAEDYDALKEFFSEYVVALLEPSGKFGWYNGLGADRQICYDVYTKVAEMDLYEAGFDTLWEDIKVPSDLHGSDQWDGTRRPYWTIDVYRLPVNTFIA